MLFRVNNPQLLKLNQKVFEFNCLFRQFYVGRLESALLNYAVFDRIVGENLDLIHSLEETPRESYAPFERLVHAHLVSNVAAQRAYLEYWFLGEIPTIEELVARIYGPEAIVWLDHQIETYNFAQEAKLAVLESRVSAAMIESGLSLVREQIEAILPFLKEELVNYAVERGLLPDEMHNSSFIKDLRISLKPSADMGAAYYTDSRLVEIGDHDFHAYLVRNRLVLNPGAAVMSLAHEVMGHALGGLWSSQMPEALSGNDMNLWNLTSMPVVEGMAVLKEEVGKDFLMKHQSKLGFEIQAGNMNRIRLRDDEVTYSILANEVEALQNLMKCYASYLALKQRDHPETDISELFASRWGKHLERSKYKIKEKVPAYESVRPEDTYDFLYSLSYVVGPQALVRMRQRVQENHKETWERMTEMERDAVLSAGAWALNVLPDWLDYAVSNFSTFKDEYMRAVLAQALPEAGPSAMERDDRQAAATG